MEYRVAYFCCVCVDSDIVFEIVLYVYICNLVCYSGASLPSCVVGTVMPPKHVRVRVHVRLYECYASDP